MDDPGLERSALVAGVFFIAAGVVFLLERLGVWDVSLRVLGPVLLITLGVAIVVGGRSDRSPS
ncbi:MAG TPA: DUF5668 domain-containing protein [Actinomycetota bacterium]|nr:DUF5668 domain-containing protein [Actinomycetota bacterium]